MSRLRARIISSLDRLGVLEATMAVRQRVRLPYVPIVTYHRIGDPTVDGRELDDGVIDATAEGFERHVAVLAKRFTIIGVDELRRFFLEGRPLPKNPALITFDDGYRACHDVALPILQSAGARAVFFISTDHMTERKVFWWDRVSYLVKRSTKSRLELEYPTHEIYDLADRPKAIWRLLKVIKNTFSLDVERFQRELAVAAGVAWTEADERRITDDVLMTWDQVRALKKAGMDVESHSRSHRVLTTLPPDEVHEELAGSKRVLEEALDKPVAAIAYPVGRDPPSNVVRNAGYDLGFTTASHGLGSVGPSTNPFELQRFRADPNLPHSFFRATVAIPHLTHWR